MNKLEQYLDQVCRGIGGPVEMRQHVRQELREHLLDAIAQHKAAGMSEEDALNKALEEFGKPEEVRTELEATHGQRMTWIIDKAMQWKEKTMKAKWLWVSWAYLGLILVIALDVAFISFTVIFLVPKFQKLLGDGIIDPPVAEDPETSWALNFIENIQYVCGHYTTFMLIGAIVLVGLFEWFVKSENKPFMRIAALGTVAIALTILLACLLGFMIILFELGMPATGRMVRPWAVERVGNIETSVQNIEDALAKKDWPEMQKQATAASVGVNQLLAGPAVTSLASPNEPLRTNELRDQVRTMKHFIGQAEQAIRAHDRQQLETALRDFRKAFEPVQQAAKRPAGP